MSNGGPPADWEAIVTKHFVDGVPDLRTEKSRFEQALTALARRRVRGELAPVFLARWVGSPAVPEDFEGFHRKH